MTAGRGDRSTKLETGADTVTDEDDPADPATQDLSARACLEETLRSLRRGIGEEGERGSDADGTDLHLVPVRLASPLNPEIGELTHRGDMVET